MEDLNAEEPEKIEELNAEETEKIQTWLETLNSTPELNKSAPLTRCFYASNEDKSSRKREGARTFERSLKHEMRKVGIVENAKGELTFEPDIVEKSPDHCFSNIINKIRKAEIQALNAEEFGTETDGILLCFCDSLPMFSELNLAGKEIEGSLDMNTFSHLLSMDLSQNAITKLESLPRTVVAACLSCNKIPEIPELSETSLRYLDMSCNPISSIQGLPNTLETLDLSHTSIASFDALTDIIPEACTTLKLAGSPLSLCPQYEALLFAKLPNMKVIDGKERPEEMPDISNISEKLNLDISLSDFKFPKPTPEISEEEKELTHQFYLEISYRLPSGVMRLGRLDWAKPEKVEYSITHEVEVSADWRNILTIVGVGFHIMGIHEVYETVENEEAKLIRVEEIALGNALVSIQSGEADETLEFHGCTAVFWRVGKMWRTVFDGEADGCSLKLKYNFDYPKKDEEVSKTES